MSEQQQTLTIQQAIDLAVQHHNAGRLPEAENIYQQILQTNPDQPDALQLLGLIAHQVGKNDTAVDLITRALAIKPDLAEAHSNLGLVLQDLGKSEDAIASYCKALNLKSDYAVAHNNLGIVLQGLGKLDEAVASYHRALAVKSDYAEAHTNLSIALRKLGHLDEAVTSCRKALGIKPDLAEAHNNLGSVLREVGHLDEAVTSYGKALALKPDYAEAHNNLGHLLGQLDRPTEAFTCHRRAISLNPENDLFWAHFALSLETASFTSVDDRLYQDLLQMVERPTIRPSYIVRPVISALRHHPDFSAIVEAVGSGQQGTEFTYSDIAEQLSKTPLFLRILELSPISDLEIERMLTVLRRAMLTETIERKTEEKVLPYSAALALHCFANEYVFAETEEEKEVVEKLEQQIATLVKRGHDVPPSFVVALGAYRSLFLFPWAQKLSEPKWTDNIKSVITRQITEPQEERSLRDQISCITAIQDTISQSVREQYEENPYPRWIKTDMAYKSESLGAVLQGPPLFLDLGDYTSPENPEILDVGCGTGQYSLFTASRYLNARVLAVDLSLSSLSYAQRKTRELGFSNIEYVQGDLTELGQLERRFDLIECIGVLHHLGDPLDGWQILVDLLCPGGLMKIGLYSKTARQHIVLGRSLIAEKGYSSSPKDIRRCRQDIIAMATNGNTEMAKISDTRDFFSLSECRDLLFHVQEQRYTLPQIEQTLKSLQLKFLGFEMEDRRTLRRFRESHPNRDCLTSLSQWHKFELDNPDTFRGMYQFWCQKL